MRPTYDTVGDIVAALIKFLPGPDDRKASRFVLVTNILDSADDEPNALIMFRQDEENLRLHTAQWDVGLGPAVCAALGQRGFEVIGWAIDSTMPYASDYQRLCALYHELNTMTKAERAAWFAETCRRNNPQFFRARGLN